MTGCPIRLSTVLLSVLALLALSGLPGCGGSDAGDGLGDPCMGSADCRPGQFCLDGVCRSAGNGAPECSGDDDCGVGRRCQAGTCVIDPNACLRDADCTDRPGGVCGAGQCYYPAPTPECEDDEECPDGEVCDAASESCVPGCRGGCDDEDPCTEDTCEGAECVYAPIEGCCSDDAACDDENPCTDDACVDATCESTPTDAPDCCVADGDCDDGDEGTVDRCVEFVCEHRPRCGSSAECDDGDACTTDWCEAEVCTNEPIAGCCTSDADCDDGSDCTTGRCVDGACQFELLPGCCVSDADCDDGDPCTADTCDVGSGSCVTETVASCCRSDADCDDGDVCTVDTCGDDGGCTHATAPDCCQGDDDCDDGAPATIDTCDTDTNRCSYDLRPSCNTDAECDDATPATIDSCDPFARTCVYQLRSSCESDADCDDRDECTFDTCADGACTWDPDLDPSCRCESERDCGDDETCGLVQLPDGGIWGYCVDVVGELRMGEPCEPGDDLSCRSGMCLELLGSHVCYGACESDDDCGGGAFCRGTDLPSGGGAPEHEMNVCVPPTLGCTDDGGCPDDMYCAAYPLPEEPGEVFLGCLPADPTRGRTGDPCASNTDCNSGFCLQDETQGGICFGLCDDDGDCRTGQRCYDDYVRMTLSMGTATPDDDRVVPVPACAWDVGSFDPCTREAQCVADEVCFPLLNDAETAFEPACVLPPEGTTTAPGDVCTNSGQCETGVCVGGRSSNRCLLFCRDTADCPEPTICVPVDFTLVNGDGSTSSVVGSVCVDD